MRAFSESLRWYASHASLPRSNVRNPATDAIHSACAPTPTATIHSESFPFRNNACGVAPTNSTPPVLDDSNFQSPSRARTTTVCIALDPSGPTVTIYAAYRPSLLSDGCDTDG